MISKLKSISYSMAESLLQFFGLLFFTIFLMREMSLQSFGVYTLLYAIGSFVSSFLQGFTEKAFIKFYAEDHLPKYIVATVLLNFGVGAVLCVLMLILSPFLISIFKNEFGFFSLVVVCVLVLTTTLRNIVKSIFIARMNFRYVFFQTLIWTIFLNAVVFFFYLKGILSPNKILLVHIVANILISIIAFIKITKENLFFVAKFDEVKQCISEQISFGKYSLGISIAFLFYTQVDTFLIGAMLGTKEVGLYEIPKRIFTFARLYSNSISQMLFPKIVRLSSDISAQKKAFFSAIKFGPLGGIVLAIASFFLLPFALPLVFGEKYLSVLSVSRLVSIFFIIHPISNFSGNTLGALNMPKEDLKTLLITFVINVVLDLTLIPFFGIAGAGYATLITVFAGGLINFSKVRKIFRQLENNIIKQ